LPNTDSCLKQARFASLTFAIQKRKVIGLACSGVSS
jgi:hypothetical protein